MDSPLVKKALIGEIALSTWLAIEPVWNLAGNDLLLAATLRWCDPGVWELVLSFVGGGTTGRNRYDGSYHPEISAALFNRADHAGYRCRRCTVGMYVFGVERALYAIIAVFLVTKVSDGIIEGLKFSKSVYIITDKPDEVSRMVMEDLDRGITGISAKGMYSGEDKLMLFCVVGKKELVHLKEKIDEIDENAFVIVGDAREVHGEGFIEK